MSTPYRYCQMTPEGLWISGMLFTQEGGFGDLEIRQGVIAGHTGYPRCAISGDGYFFGLSAAGSEISPREALSLGLIEPIHPILSLPVGDLINAHLVLEVQRCGLINYALPIRACESVLPPKVGEIELRVLRRFVEWHEQMTPYVARILLFGEPVKSLRQPELAATIKLIRRNLLRAYRLYTRDAGYMLRIEVGPDPALYSSMVDFNGTPVWKCDALGLSSIGESRTKVAEEWLQSFKEWGTS